MAASGEVDFFISYAHPDSTWAAWLAWNLEEAGYTTRHQGWDFPAGSNFVLEMQRAAENSRRTIVVISPAFTESGFVQPEWAAAFAEDPTAKDRRLIPVRVGEVQLGGLLSPLVYIDLVGLSAEEARAEFLRRISGKRLKPAAEPGYPAGGETLLSEGKSKGPCYPGDRPTVWNAPRTGRSFSGRGTLLDAIAAEFDADSSFDAPLAVTLHGLGGVGKTQAAAGFAWRSRAEYDVVWWIRATETMTRTADYSQLARALDLEVEEGEIAEVEAVRAWLGQHERWLLVFDDAPDADSVQDLLPKGGGGRVLVTSRRTGGWRSVASPLSVDTWSSKTAARFLLERSGGEEDGESLEIATALGGLPLAMEQAGAYIDTMGITLRDYRERLAKHAPELFELGGPVDYGKTVRTTWELCFREVEEDLDARAVLVSCSLLAPDRIPDAIIRAQLPDLMRCDRALEKLLQFSLIPLGNHRLDMHVLVQQAVRDRTSERDGERTRGVLLEILVELFPERSHPPEWPIGIVLLPHALRLLREGLEDEDTNRPIALRLADRLGEFHHARGELKHALVLAEMIAAMAGPDQELTRRNLTNLGTLRMRLGDAEGAQNAHEAALASWIAVHGERHPNVAASLDNLGIVLRRRGEVAMAIATHERALAIFEGLLGEDCLESAATLDNLSNALRLQGDIDGAVENLERALTIKTREYGENDSRLARTLDSLGSGWMGRGNWKRARDFYERALTLQEASLGPEHHEVGGTLSNLGIVLMRQGEVKEARGVQERALEIFISAFGDAHPAVAQIQVNLGNVARSTGEEEEARELFERALTIKEDTLGAEHPELIAVLINLSDLLTRRDDLAAARSHAVRAHSIASQYFHGTSHPSLRISSELLTRLDRLEAHRPTD